MNRMELIKEQIIVTKQLVNFMLLKNQKPLKYGNDELIYPAEADILAAIGKNKGIYAADIAKSFGISKSAVSKTIRKLHKKGLIAFATDQMDSRKTILSLTPKGKTVFQYHKRIDTATFSEILDGISTCTDEELQAYIKIAKINVKARYKLLENEDGIKI